MIFITLCISWNNKGVFKSEIDLIIRVDKPTATVFNKGQDVRLFGSS